MKRIAALILSISLAGTAFGDVYFTSNASHSDNVEIAAQFLANRLGGDYVAFNGSSDSDWDLAFAGADYILVGQDASTGSLDAGTITDLETWVSAGGTLLTLRDQAAMDLVGSVIGDTPTISGDDCCDPDFNATKQPEVNGTVFDTAPGTLPALDDFGFFDIGSVPVSLTIAYMDQFDNGHVLFGDHGDGRVAYLSFDWCCGFNSFQFDQWNAALEAAAGSAPVPVTIPQVPTLGTWALIFMALLLAAFAAPHVRRRMTV